jgi:hypothetical protein
MIKVKCPNTACGKYAAVKEEFAGKRAKCPACGTVISIPSISSQPPRTPAAPLQPTPPSPVPEEEESDIDARKPKPRYATSTLLQGIAIAGFVLGGLALAYSVWFLIYSGVDSTGHANVTGNLPAAEREKIAKAFEEHAAKQPGATRIRWTIRLMILASVVAIVWAALAIAAGVGLLQRRKWGWILGLASGGCAAILALLSLLPVFVIGYWAWLANFVLYAGYATAAFLILTQARTRQEFEPGLVGGKTFEAD